MKRPLLKFLLLALLLLGPIQQASAFNIAEIIRQAIVKVIRAVDLAIQRQQNKIIWLQNAQKTLENAMAKLKLGEINDWTEKSRKLYDDYFKELQQVKNLIAYYQRIKEISVRFYKAGDEYRRVWKIIREDKHFSTGERAYMAKVYAGMMAQSEKEVTTIVNLVEQFSTSMSDGQRLELINRVSEAVEKTIDDMSRFSNQNMTLSLQRARSSHEAAVIKQLYGLP